MTRGNEVQRMVAAGSFLPEIITTFNEQLRVLFPNGCKVMGLEVDLSAGIDNLSSRLSDCHAIIVELLVRPLQGTYGRLIYDRVETRADGLAKQSAHARSGATAELAYIAPVFSALVPEGRGSWVALLGVRSSDTVGQLKESFHAIYLEEWTVD